MLLIIKHQLSLPTRLKTVAKWNGRMKSYLDSTTYTTDKRQFSTAPSKEGKPIHSILNQVKESLLLNSSTNTRYKQEIHRSYWPAFPSISRRSFPIVRGSLGLQILLERQEAAKIAQKYGLTCNLLSPGYLLRLRKQIEYKDVKDQENKEKGKSEDEIVEQEDEPTSSGSSWECDAMRNYLLYNKPLPTKMAHYKMIFGSTSGVKKTVKTVKKSGGARLAGMMFPPLLFSSMMGIPHVSDCLDPVLSYGGEALERGVESLINSSTIKDPNVDDIGQNLPTVSEETSNIALYVGLGILTLTLAVYCYGRINKQ